MMMRPESQCQILSSYRHTFMSGCGVCRLMQQEVNRRLQERLYSINTETPQKPHHSNHSSQRLCLFNQWCLTLTLWQSPGTNTGDKTLVSEMRIRRLATSCRVAIRAARSTKQIVRAMGFFSIWKMTFLTDFASMPSISHTFKVIGGSRPPRIAQAQLVCVEPRVVSAALRISTGWLRSNQLVCEGQGSPSAPQPHAERIKVGDNDGSAQETQS